MSEPRNHHYVSQVLSRKFFNSNGNAYLFDKAKNKFETVNSTRFLFSERDLNSRIIEDGNIEHSSVESLLNRYFENPFNTHYNTIVAAVEAKHSLYHVIPNSDEVQKAMEFLILMGNIGAIRNPNHMKWAENAIFGPLFMIAENATDELRNEIYSAYQRVFKVTNKTPVDYKELSEGIAKLMGDTTHSIFVAPEDTYFILPDSTSTVKRYKLLDDVIVDGETYISPAKSIGTVLMPINSKILIAAVSRKVLQGNNGIYQLKKETVMDYNKALLDSSFEAVICENETYLKAFVQSYLGNKS